jgi:hypothetical protein
MRDELKVPQVFEPGARVELGGHACVLKCIEDGWWRGFNRSGVVFSLCHETTAALSLNVIAPAPRAGQRWEAGGSEGGTCWVDREDPVEMGRWLLDRGYSFAGESDAAPETLRASEAAAVPQPPAPAPWTLTAARRLITETIAAAKPRRPEAFTSAMCSLSEVGTPHWSVVRAVAAALATLEAALPEYGAAAEWQIARARALAEDVFRTEAQMEHVPVRAWVAFEMYVARRSR